jgi:hypothetical protein
MYYHPNTFRGRSETLADERADLSSSPTIEELTAHVKLVSETLEALLWAMHTMINKDL